MSEEFNQAIAGLREAAAEAANLQVEIIRRRALYPDLSAMEKRTAQIRRERAAIPINEADQDVEHLLHHIDMLNKELRKANARSDG